MSFPRLKLAEIASGLDEAVITIDGREEDQIIISCEGSLDLADRLIRYVNNHDQIVEALTAAAACLRDIGSPLQAYDTRSLAEHCNTLLLEIGAAA